MEDWVGWVLVPISLGLVLIDPAVSRSAKVTLAVWAAVLAHNANSITNAYFTATYGATADAQTFHAFAANHNYVADSFGSSDYYTYLLGSAYELFGISLFFGQQLSVLASAFKIMLVVRATVWTGYRRYLVPIVLMVGLLPGPVMFSSITMREAYQSLFFTAAAVVALRLRRTRNPLWLPVMYACLVAMGSMHGATFLYALACMALMTLYALGTGSWRLRIFLRLVVLGMLVLVAGWVLSNPNFYTGVIGIVAMNDAEDIGSIAEKFSEGAPEGRTGYAFKPQLTSPAIFFLTFPLILFQYMFAPYPWQLGGALDLYAIFESLLRAGLLAGAVARSLKRPGEERSWTLFLLASAMSMEALWATGTFNYGTAIRHHVVAYPLLVLAGAPFLLMGLTNGYRRTMGWLLGRQGMTTRTASNASA